MKNCEIRAKICYKSSQKYNLHAQFSEIFLKANDANILSPLINK